MTLRIPLSALAFCLMISCGNRPDVATKIPEPPSRVLQLAELNTDQIRALDHLRTAIIVPIAILEQHGPYLPSYSDGYPAERLTGELGEALAGRPGWSAAVFPVIPLGNGGGNQIGQKWVFPGSYTVRASTLRAVMMDLATELGEQGFRWVFLVTLHAAPNHHRALDEASEFFRDEFGGTMVNLFGLMPVFEARGSVSVPESEAAEDGFGVHAGLRETSDMLFHRPDLVPSSYRTAPSITGHNMADVVRLGRQDNWAGYFGAPRFANAAFGAKAWKGFSTTAVTNALAILDGADPSKMPRYSTVADGDAATQQIDHADALQDDRVAERQRRWLVRKGYQ